MTIQTVLGLGMSEPSAICSLDLAAFDTVDGFRDFCDKTTEKKKVSKKNTGDNDWYRNYLNSRKKLSFWGDFSWGIGYISVGKPS